MVSLAPTVLGELLSLGSTAHDLFDRCSKASSEFQEAKTELLALHTILTHLELLTKSPILNTGRAPSSTATALPTAGLQQTIEGRVEKGLLTAPPADSMNGENEGERIVEIKEGEEENTSLTVRNNETGLTTQNNETAVTTGTNAANGVVAATDWPDDSFLTPKTREDIQNLAIGCKSVLMDFDNLLSNHKAMEKAKENARIWKPGTLLDKYRFSNKVVEVNALRSKLTYHTSAITMMLTVLGSSSLGRIEGSLSKLENMMAQAAIERQKPIQNTAVFINSPGFQHLSPQDQARFLQGDPTMLHLLANQPDMLGQIQSTSGRPKTSNGGGHGAKMIDWDKGEKYLIDSWEKSGRPGSSNGLFGRSSSTRKTKGREMALVRSRTMPVAKLREDQDGKRKRRDWGEGYFQDGWEKSKKERERNGISGKEKSSSRRRKVEEDAAEYSGDDGPPPPIEEEEKEREKEKERGKLVEDQGKDKQRSHKSRSKESTPSTPVKEKKKLENLFFGGWEKPRPSPVKSKSDSKVPTKGKDRESESKAKKKRGDEEEERKGKEKGAVSKKSPSKDKGKDRDGESKEEREKRRAEKRSRVKETKESTNGEADGGNADGEGGEDGKDRSIDGDKDKDEQPAEILQFDLSKQDGEVEGGEGQEEKKEDKLVVEVEETSPTNEPLPQEDRESNTPSKPERETNDDPAGEKKEKKERRSKSSKDKDKEKEKEKANVENGDTHKKHRSKSHRDSKEKGKISSSDKVNKSSKNKQSKDDSSLRSSTKSAGSATGEVPRKGKDRSRRDRESSHRDSREVKEKPIVRRTRSLSPTKRRGGIFDINLKLGKEREQEGGLESKAVALKSGREKDREKRRDREKVKDKER